MTDAADMNPPKGFELRPIGYARSDLMARADAPRQAWEGAPEARLEILPEFAPALDGTPILDLKSVLEGPSAA
jgi:tRNA (Thr-GGU) A37 N-methylase